MEIIDRYIYAVVRQLDADEKQEVEKELKMLIYEMMEEQSGEMEEIQKARCVIEKLGSPDKLADKYRGGERCLIGGRYFNQYKNVLKIVLVAVFTGVTVGSFFSGITSDKHIGMIISEYIGIILEAILQAIAWVTIIFAIFEYKKISIPKAMDWSIESLPMIPSKKAMISKGESVATIIFTTIFTSIFYFVPQLIGVYYMNKEELVHIPVFDVAVLNQYKVLIILIFIIEILQESLKLVWGVWNKKRALIATGMTILSSLLSIILFSVIGILSSDILEFVTKFTGFEAIRLPRIFTIIIVICAIVESVSVLYKGYKYDSKKA